MEKLKSVLVLGLFLFSGSLISAENKDSRKDQVEKARLQAVAFVKEALNQLDFNNMNAFDGRDPHLGLQLDRVIPVAEDVLKKLLNKKLKIHFPNLNQADDPECLKQQQIHRAENDQQESYRRHEEHENHDQDYDRRKNPAAANVLAYVDNRSDWDIYLCHAFFKFPQRLDKDANPVQTKLEARAQVFIHEAIHFVLGHTHNAHMTFGEKEKECSWYTYETMIHSSLNRFYEDAYYTMFGFHLPNLKYHNGVQYKRRYMNHVLR